METLIIIALIWGFGYLVGKNVGSTYSVQIKKVKTKITRSKIYDYLAMLPPDKYEKTMRILIKEYRQHFFNQRYINHPDIANDPDQKWKIDNISESEIYEQLKHGFKKNL